MFTHYRHKSPQFTGDWKVDGPLWQKQISDYWLSLEKKGALAIQPQDIDNLPVISVDDYIIKGSADATKGIQAATAALTALGSGILDFGKGKNYTVFTAGNATLIDLTAKSNIIIRGNGATITSAQVNPAAGAHVIYCPGAQNIIVEGLNFVGGNSSLSDDGERFLSFGDIGAGGNRRITLTNCKVTNCLTGAQCTTAPTAAQNYGLTYTNCYFEKCFYPLIAHNTDDVNAQYVARNCGRAYFVNAPANNHVIYLDSRQGYTSADCLLQINADNTYARPEYTNAITNIDLHYQSDGRIDGAGDHGDSIVYLDFKQGASAGGAIFRNIRINLNVNGLNDAGDADDSPKTAVFLAKRVNNGDDDTTATRGHILEGLKISGILYNWQEATNGVVLCSLDAGGGGPADWTGESISGISLRDLRIEGTPSGNALYVNGQGAISGAPFLTLDNVYLDGSKSYNNIGSARIAESNFKASSYDAANVVPTTRTPTWTGSVSNPAIVDGTLSARYHKHGVMVTESFVVIPGASTTFGSGDYSLSTAFTAASDGIGAIGSVYAFRSGTGIYTGACRIQSGGSTLQAAFGTAAGNLWGATAPWTFANGDYAIFTITYRVQ